MSIIQQANRLGFSIIGDLVRRMDRECSHLYEFYEDSAGNTYIVRRGILTIISASGDVY